MNKNAEKRIVTSNKGVSNKNSKKLIFFCIETKYKAIINDNIIIEKSTIAKKILYLGKLNFII